MAGFTTKFLSFTQKLKHDHEEIEDCVLLSIPSHLMTTGSGDIDTSLIQPFLAKDGWFSLNLPIWDTALKFLDTACSICIENIFKPACQINAHNLSKIGYVIRSLKYLTEVATSLTPN